MIHKNFQIKADHIKKIMTIPILLAKQLKNFVGDHPSETTCNNITYSNTYV